MFSVLKHDSTNKGPIVRAEECADLRMLLKAMREDSVHTVSMNVGLFERLLFTAEKLAATEPNRGR